METTLSTVKNRSTEHISVEPWHSEMLLKVFVVLISISVWIGLTISIFGIVYVAFIGLFLFFTHLLFVATVRGNAVRVGPDQYPELYARVERLSRRAGLDYVPETYVMQAGGALNALATKFLRSRMVVIFSDLLDACDNDEHAQDMIIGHEIGHIKAGHLDAFWFLLPGLWMPFLGGAYSRAREYTCDRYGFALAGDPAGALKGLTILSAGKNYGARVNVSALVKQRESLNTGLMTLGKWFMSHPPLCDRIAALDRTLAAAMADPNRGRNRALLTVALFFLVVFGGITVAGVAFFSAVKTAHKVKAAIQNAGAQGTYSTGYGYDDSSAVDSTSIRFLGGEEDSARR
jgi:Zn-dependent protease with chaperone function